MGGLWNAFEKIYEHWSRQKAEKRMRANRCLRKTPDISVLLDSSKKEGLDFFNETERMVQELSHSLNSTKHFPDLTFSHIWPRIIIIWSGIVSFRSAIRVDFDFHSNSWWFSHNKMRRKLIYLHINWHSVKIRTMRRANNTRSVHRRPATLQLLTLAFSYLSHPNQ